MSITIGRTKIAYSEVNRAAAGDAAAFFNACNENYERKVREIARRIRNHIDTTRVILLSGPSASGKTTTSLKIREELARLGIEAVTISLDDYFKNRDDTPLLADGSRDFESLDALDVDFLRTSLSDLIEKGSAAVPAFNFKQGKRAPSLRRVTLGPGSVAVVEGLHALNSRISQGMPEGHLLKIYISVSSDFVRDNGRVALSAREARLIRRTVRDHRFRGTGPEQTLSMWDAVCRGENAYVRPFKKDADVTFNSVFQCEPCLFGAEAARLFSSVPPESVFYNRARHIVETLSLFEKMPLSFVPGTCVLREFLGGSDYFNKKSKNGG